MGKTPCRPFSGLRVSCGGVLVTPGLGERALDQAQDDLMGKKCPQEEYQALTAKTTVYLSQPRPPYLPAATREGAPGSLGPCPGLRPRGWDPGQPHPLSLNLVVSVSHCLCLCLCIFISDSLCLQPHPSSGGFTLQHSPGVSQPRVLPLWLPHPWPWRPPPQDGLLVASTADLGLGSDPHACSPRTCIPPPPPRSACPDAEVWPAWGPGTGHRVVSLSRGLQQALR